MRTSWPALAAAIALLAAAGCSDDTTETNPDGAVADAPAADSVAYPDLGGLPDLPVQGQCDSEWRDAISPQKSVSKGAVTTTVVGGVNQTEIDATAGGMSSAHKNPWVYVSLRDGGKRVEIDDFAARTSTAWDLALRRSVIRINGGDSSKVGQGAVAIVISTTLDKVSSVPPSSQFAQDDFLDDKCAILRNPINNIRTAFGGANGMWYQYDTGQMKLTPNPDSYVVRSGDGKQHFKLYINTYYDPSTGAGAHFNVSWSELK